MRASVFLFVFESESKELDLNINRLTNLTRKTFKNLHVSLLQITTLFEKLWTRTRLKLKTIF